jgi:hypothetical protein
LKRNKDVAISSREMLCAVGERGLSREVVHTFCVLPGAIVEGNVFGNKPESFITNKMHNIAIYNFTSKI